MILSRKNTFLIKFTERYCLTRNKWAQELNSSTIIYRGKKNKDPDNEKTNHRWEKIFSKAIPDKGLVTKNIQRTLQPPQ